MTLAILVAAALAAPPASADLMLGETKRYVGPTNGLDPCKIPDGEVVAYGGACFDVTHTGVRMRIVIDDDVSRDVYAYYRVLDANGNAISGGNFCTEKDTPPIHANAKKISVSIYVDQPEHCRASDGGGVSGTISVRVKPETDSAMVSAT